MTYQIIADPRRVADRLSTLTGRRSVYSGVPDREYCIGPYTVITKGQPFIKVETADERIIQKLITEELILPAGVRQEPVEKEPILAQLSVSFPAEGHNARTLTNLIYLMYCRGEIISKATGGCFQVDDKLITREALLKLVDLKNSVAYAADVPQFIAWGTKDSMVGSNRQNMARIAVGRQT